MKHIKYLLYPWYKDDEALEVFRFKIFYTINHFCNHNDYENQLNTSQIHFDLTMMQEGTILKNERN